MSVSIQVRQVGDVTIMSCTGQITLGEATSAFRNTVREILNKGAQKLLIDLGKVTYLDSSGIGELVGSYSSASRAGASMKLVHLPKKIYDLLQITKLITVFQVFEDEAEAVRSFT
ncbi:MAG: STAS domain-containing protein [Bryobacterales bacterium]|nr:STAS domain-containing protein [Bryobacterales bacterium]